MAGAITGSVIGSVIGPLLFVIYVNDLLDHLSQTASSLQMVFNSSPPPETAMIYSKTP